MHKFILLYGIRLIVLLFVSLIFLPEIKSQAKIVQLIQTCDHLPKLEDTLIVNKNGLEVTELLSPVIAKLISEDRLEASVDSIVLDTITDTQLSYIHLGPKYDFNSIKLDSLSGDLLDRLNIMNPLTTVEFIETRQALSEYYANHGYPFATIRLEDLAMEEGAVSGHLNVHEGNQVIMDSIIVNGKVQIRQSYLKNYLELYKGDPYDHSKITAVKRKLDRLRFLKTTEEPNLSFVYDYASLNLFVAPKNTSRFDMIFGVIPTNSIMGKQLFLSLDFTAELLNKFGYGEYIFLNFERLRPEQQKLDVRFNYPYVLDSPFAVDVSLEIFRNALDYQTVKSDIGVQYLLNSTDHIKVAWNYESSKIIEVDSLAIVNSKELPTDLSVVQSGLAVEALISKLDYRFNPRRGYSIKFGAVGGQRKILIDPSILALSNNEVDFQTKYDSLDLVSPRYEVTADFSYFRPISRRGTAAFHFKGGWRYTPGELLRNEKFQIGGNKLLRGFDEASLFTSYYGVTTIEYRLLLSENSYFSAPFVDVGYIESEDGGQLAIGLGAGLIAETKVGLFNFSVAVGKNENLPFDFGKPKAHFGFISLF